MTPPPPPFLQSAHSQIPFQHRLCIHNSYSTFLHTFPFSAPVHLYAYLYSRVPPSNLPTSRVSWKNILKRNIKTKNCHSLLPLHGKRKHINNMLFCEVFSLLFYFYIFLWEQEWERRDIFMWKSKKHFVCKCDYTYKFCLIYGGHQLFFSDLSYVWEFH